MSDFGYPGFYVNIEGIDGSGKSSVISGLKETLFDFKGLQRRAIFLRQPGGSEFAEKYRHACLNEDLSIEAQTLFYSSLIVDSVQKKVIPALFNNAIVISDRGFGTTLCYQGLNAGNEGMVLNILKSLTSLPTPDLTIYLSIPLEVAIERESGQGRSQDRYGEFSLRHKELIKEAYDRVFAWETETDYLQGDKYQYAAISEFRNYISKRITVVNANQPIEQVIESCKSAIELAITGVDK